MNTELENSMVKIWSQDQQTEIINESLSKAERIQDALSELNLADMNRILESLIVAFNSATDGEKYLIRSTIKKVGKARASQIEWLCEEYSKN
jgi:glutamate/tyrosine decarboxylase-like PLP-dependent enzyme